MSIAKKALFGALLLGAALGFSGVATAQAKWVEGRHYQLIRPAQPQQVPKGKVEVTEVFSYGCPACFQFQPIMDRIKQGLPANAQVNLLHAAWNRSESWPVFQRAYITAQTLGIAEKNHQAMFNAIWSDNGELAVADTRTGRLKAKQPTIEDVARFYAKRGDTTEEKFLQTAKSFSTEMRVKQTEALIKAFSPPGTPCLVVAGKYRIDHSMLSSPNDFLEIVKFLVQKEAAGGTT